MLSLTSVGALNKVLELEPDDFIQRLKKRDPETVAKVVNEHQSFLFRSAMAMGCGSSDVEDLLQSTWGTFFSVLDRFEGKSKVRTFIYGILYNKFRELRRSNQRIETIEESDDLVDSLFDKEGYWTHPPISPEKFTQMKQFEKSLHDCLNVLPFQLKSIFLMREMEECSLREIAEAHLLDDNHVGVLIYRAKQRLRTCLEGKLGSDKK